MAAPSSRPSIDTPQAAPQASSTAAPTYQQTQQDQPPCLHHETAYSFVAPNWDPLVGRSRQHARVEKEVSVWGNRAGAQQGIGGQGHPKQRKQLPRLT